MITKDLFPGETKDKVFPCLITLSFTVLKKMHQHNYCFLAHHSFHRFSLQLLHANQFEKNKSVSKYVSPWTRRKLNVD